MNLLWAVAVDLYTFAVTALFGTRTPHASHEEHVIHVSPRPERLALVAPTSVEADAIDHEHEHAHLESVFEHMVALPKKNTIAYVATSGAPLRIQPEKGMDTIIDRMPFGAMLVAVEQVGEWVRVFHAGKEGFVELIDLADRAAFVHPKFVIGAPNDANDPATERVRAMIQDEFSYGEGEMPLQAEEYVLYKLVRNGVRPAWPSTRPRTPGTWARILRGAPGVSISVEPSPRSVVEWDLGHKGHVAFVEAVYPDGTIQLSEANWPDRGIYNERVLVREEWMALAPFFISFT
jgi:hypothetical protein